MPHPRDDAKATGDLQPPEADPAARQRPGAERAQGSAKGGALERELEDEARAGKGENQAGFLKEKDGEAGRNT